MTEATPEATAPTLTEVLVRHAFYSHNGIIRIAIDDNTLQDLTGTDTYVVTPQQVVLIAEPTLPDWADRMLRIRSTTVRALTNSQKELHERISHFERLKEAILEVADEKQWCEDYDDFAETWGLLKRTKDWEVVMTVRVEARTKDDAIEIVSGGVSLDRWHTEGVDSNPEYSACEV
jgi:hypothetical protein